MVDAPVHHPGFGEAVALVLRTCARRLRPCLRIAAPYAIFVGLFNAVTKLTLVAGPNAVTVSEVAVVGVAVVVAFVVFIALSSVAVPLTIGGLSLIGSAEVYGDEVDVRGIARQVADHAFDVVGAFVVTALVLAAAPLAAGVLALMVAFIAKPITGVAVLIFAVVVLLVPQIYVAIKLSLAVPAVMREGVKPNAALQRSWRLVHGTRWAWVFGVGLAVAAIVGVVVAGLSLFVGALHATGVLALVVDFAAWAVDAAVATIVVGVATGVVYATLAPEGIHVPAELAAHEVLPAELPPLPFDRAPEGPAAQ